MKSAAETLDRGSYFITTKTAAQVLAMTTRKVQDMCAKGEIKAIKIGSDWRINTAAFLEQFGI